MMNGAETLLYLMGNLFRIYVVYRFYLVFFDQRTVKRGVAIGAYFVFFAVNSYLFLKYNEPYLNLLSNIAFLIIITFLYRSRLRVKLLAVIMSLAIALFFEEFVYRVLIVFFGGNDVVAGIIVPNLLMFPVVLILERIPELQEGDRVSVVNAAFIVLVPSLSIFILAVALYNYPVDGLVAAVAGGLLAMNVGIFYLLDQIIRKSRQELELELQRKQLEMYEREFRLMRQSEENVTTLRHDLKNHLIVLRVMAEKENSAVMASYLGQLDEFLRPAEEFAHTGNIAVDSILNLKFLEAEELGAELVYSVQIGKDIPVAAEDLSCILGNLLDNALRALGDCDEKRLWVRIDQERNTLYISVRNTYEGQLRERGGRLLTTKKEKGRHGLGLKSVEQAAERWQGELAVHHGEGEFLAEVMLFFQPVEAAASDNAEGRKPPAAEVHL